MADFYIMVNLVNDQTRVRIEEYEDSERATLVLETSCGSTVTLDFTNLGQIEDFRATLGHVILHQKTPRN